MNQHPGRRKRDSPRDLHPICREGSRVHCESDGPLCMPALSFEDSLPMSKSLRLWTCTDLRLVPTPCVTVRCDPSDTCHRYLWDRDGIESAWHSGWGVPSLSSACGNPSMPRSFLARVSYSLTSEDRVRGLARAAAACW